MKLSSLSILIPAYKDEDTIEFVVKRAVQAARAVTSVFEIIVLNDASPDNTGIVLQKLKKQIPQLKVRTHVINQGYGRTFSELYFSGIYDWLYIIPGDYQIDPMEIKKLVSSTNRADMIIGRRIHRQDNEKRKQQSAIYNALLCLLFGITLHDINSIRLMKRIVVKRNNILNVKSAFVDAQLTISAIRDGFMVIERPIVHRKRISSGASGGKLKIIIPVIIDMMKYKLRNLL
ncbi:MAG: glycosyltransferase [Microgenomates group bacterium GW2011_GWC1_39_12]|nr:MAG: glycosyltransferase [Microgenomates group bacterium GW2011_GWC1_39_12]